MDITQLPFNALIGLARAKRPGHLLCLPGADRYTNHLGTVHAGALMALAEASSGEFLLQSLEIQSGSIVPVVRRFECKFSKPASGEISSVAAVSDEALGSMLAALKQRGRALVDVAVEIYDASDTRVLAATIGWFLSREQSASA